MYIPKTDDYLKSLTDDEVNVLVNVLNVQKKNCILNFVMSKILEKLTTPDEVEKYVKIMRSNSSDNYVHHYNVKILYLFDP